MLIEAVIFAGVFSLLMLKMKNKGEWLYNIKHHRGDNWKKAWHSIPTTKLVFMLFVLVFSCAVWFSLFPISINYLVWDLFFILHFALFILAGALLYLFIWSLGGRAVRIGKAVGKLSPVEGTEPAGESKPQGETFADGMFRAFYDVTLGESKRKRKKKRR